LERITSRSLPIQVITTGEPATGYAARAPELSARTVVITGPEKQVDSVSEIAITVDLEGRKESLERTVSLRPVDSSGQFVAGLALQPSTLQVTVSLEQLESYRDVAVRASIQGEVASGYRVTNISTTPSVVTVFSNDLAQIAALPGFVETETLDISDAGDDVEARLTLRLPPGVSLIGEQAVLVQVTISAIESSLTMQRTFQFTGLEPGLAAIPSPDSVELILSGALPVLDRLQPEDVTVILDVLGLAIGTHQVIPQVIVAPEGVSADTVLPASIQVAIEVDTSTPTLEGTLAEGTSSAPTGTPSATPGVSRTPAATPRPPTATATPR